MKLRKAAALAVAIIVLTACSQDQSGSAQDTSSPPSSGSVATSDDPNARVEATAPRPSDEGATAGGPEATSDPPAETDAPADDVPPPPTTDPPVDPNKPLSDPAMKEPQEPVDIDAPATVAVSEPADFGNGITAEVTSVDKVSVQAVQRGETAGNAAAVHLTVRNGSADPADLDAIAVNVTAKDGVPLVPNFGAPSAPLSGTLPPGESRSGVYVFRTDAGLDDLLIDIHHNSTANFVVIGT